MGTSTVHRSPSTSRWRIVNNLNDRPAPSPELLLAEIFNAAEHYSSGLADPAVLERVEVLLSTVDIGHWRPDIDEALAAARQAVAAAQQAAFSAGRTSFYGDLADRALHAT